MMESKLSASAKAQLDRFCRQYLQLHFALEYPDNEHLRNDTFQRSLHLRLFDERVLKHAPPHRYQLRVLKELTKRIEQSIQDWEEEGISDDIMNYFSSLLVSSVPSEAASAQQKAYVTYALSTLPSDNGATPSIALLESRSLLSAIGTTGLRTWEAAFHLGNYLCSRADLVHGQSILELGAGTGYISILCAKHLHASHVLATDGSDDVVTDLGTNFYLNGLQDSSMIEGKELKWGQALVGSEHSDWNGGRKIDLVLGADLAYEGSGILALLSTIGDLFDLYPDVKIILAVTVRNQKTFKTFLDTCRGFHYLAERIDFNNTPACEQMGPFYSDLIHNELYLIRKPRMDKNRRGGEGKI